MNMFRFEKGIRNEITNVKTLRCLRNVISTQTSDELMTDPAP